MDYQVEPTKKNCRVAKPFFARVEIVSQHFQLQPIR